MAKETIGTIELDIPAEWDRKTIADGTWLQRNTLKPIYDNEKTLAAAISDSSGAFENSASRIFFEDDGEDVLNDLYFRNTEGRAYAAELSKNGSDTSMIIPCWSEPDHETRQLFFGWNAEDGYDFYEQSPQLLPDVSGSNYIEVKRITNQDGHDTYSASFIPNKIRSWREGNIDVGNILIQERNGFLELSAGASSHGGGGGSTIYQHVHLTGQPDADVPKNLRYDNTLDNNEAVRVEAANTDAQYWPSDYEFVWPHKCEGHNDNSLFYYNIDEDRYSWIDQSAVARVSIGRLVANSDVLCVL